VVVLIIGLFGITGPASANVVDDYFACMVGKGAVAMNKQTAGHIDPGKAKADAASQCSRPKEADSDPRLDWGIARILTAIANVIN
jgi:hypothetical protein